jgi:hypothetical protein
VNASDVQSGVFFVVILHTRTQAQAVTRGSKRGWKRREGGGTVAPYEFGVVVFEVFGLRDLDVDHFAVDQLTLQARVCLFRRFVIGELHKCKACKCTRSLGRVRTRINPEAGESSRTGLQSDVVNTEGGDAFDFFFGVL